MPSQTVVVEIGSLWKTETDAFTGKVTITNPEDDPWYTEVLVQLPHGAKPVEPEDALLDIYVAMVIGERSKTRDFGDKVAMDQCTEDVHTAISYVSGWVEVAAPAGLDKEAKHMTIMQQLRGMPTEMLDKTYNLYRTENHGINLDDRPEYRTYQTFYEIDIMPPTHEEMADIIIRFVVLRPFERK